MIFKVVIVYPPAPIIRHEEKALAEAELNLPVPSEEHRQQMMCLGFGAGLLRLTRINRIYLTITNKNALCHVYI